MKIETKKSKKPVKYKDALDFMEQRVRDINHKKSFHNDRIKIRLVI